ncbi:transcriptional regulator CysB-like protein [Neisseria gonorrhoeae]|uniref:Transcriptional regulator CysB-like protein n=1 Tax=Neisseria gonorrhoeae TaxID=485 RepID=A0A378VSP1_NEIGO|nr:transcriptional regulator CysB-like protein [Neisseria gonorrhoeae]
MKRYPKVNLTIKQGSPAAIAQMVTSGESDLAIVTERIDDHPELGRLSCYDWTHAVIVPNDHPLLECRNPLRIEDLARFPLITYEFAFNAGSSIARAFAKARLERPDVALAAADTDVLKTYVRLGLGVGLMAKMAYNPDTDGDLQLVDAAHLFEPSPTWIALRSDTYLRGYAYDFIQAFAPHLTREKVDRILYTPISEDFSI